MSAGERHTKQVIVIRKDLKMRRGKEIAQGGHAVSEWLVRMVTSPNPPYLTVAQRSWLTGPLKTKVTVTVSSAEELLGVYHAAVQAHLPVHLVEDLGLTEFHGQKTATCLAIGPDWSDLIDPITGHLPLY